MKILEVDRGPLAMRNPHGQKWVTQQIGVSSEPRMFKTKLGGQLTPVSQLPAFLKRRENLHHSESSNRALHGRNPKQPPGMYKTLYIVGYLPYSSGAGFLNHHQYCNLFGTKKNGHIFFGGYGPVLGFHA